MNGLEGCLSSPEAARCPWLMRFPEDSFDSVSRASVVLPVAIEHTWGSRPGRPAERDRANACGASCRRRSIVAVCPISKAQEQVTMAEQGDDGFKML